MTVKRATDITIALYYSLLERGFDENQSVDILYSIDSDIIRKHKGAVIQTLADDIWEAYTNICSKITADEHRFDLLLKAIECHHEVDQPIY